MSDDALLPAPVTAPPPGGEAAPPLRAVPVARPAPPVLSAHRVYKDYRDGLRTVTVLRGLDIEIRPGESLAVTGRSGSGKSTLLHLLGLLDRPTAGQIYFHGEPVGELGEGRRNLVRARSLGFVFQAYHLIPELNALQNVLLAARVAEGLAWPFRWAGARREARELLGRVGLGHRLRHRPAKLSGGEKQRVAIARALMGSREVLLADEPTGNLDAATAGEVEDLLFTLAAERGLAMVLVTHEPELAGRCSRVCVLESGRLAETPAPAAGDRGN